MERSGIEGPRCFTPKGHPFRGIFLQKTADNTGGTRLIPIQLTATMYHRLWRKCEKWVDYLWRKRDDMIVITERNREGKICLNEKYIMKY